MLFRSFEETDPTAEQVASLEALCRWLCAKCGIPWANVMGHGEAHGNATLCPGRRLDLEALRQRLGVKPR